MYKHGFKIIIKCTLSLLVLIIINPAFLISYIRIKYDSKDSYIFKQQRMDKNKKLFSIYNFCSMWVETLDLPKLNKLLQFIQFKGILGKTLLNIIKEEISFINFLFAVWVQKALVLVRDKFVAGVVQSRFTGFKGDDENDDLEIKKPGLIEDIKSWTTRYRDSKSKNLQHFKCAIMNALYEGYI